jgi:hypothetical protein
MKKTIVIILILGLLSLAMIGTAFAQGRMSVVKGQVTVVAADTVTVQSVKGDTVIVTLPSGFDATTVDVDDTVMAKGTMEGNTLKADTVRVLSKNGHGKPENPGKASSAFCSEDKQGLNHPLADKLAEKYGVTKEWVMKNYCNGNSMGAIMLALKTVILKATSEPAGSVPMGTDLENAADEILLLRTGGEGWGKIWQEKKLIGSEQEVKTPPGKLNKNK